jgi:hypothetical protein
MEVKLSAFGLQTDALALLNAKDKQKMLNYYLSMFTSR